MSRQLRVEERNWPLREPFVISRETQTVAETIIVEVEEEGRIGRGEAAGVSYHGETIASLIAQIWSVRNAVIAGADRRALLKLLPPGGARNAIDCALWDLEAKLTGVSVWESAGVSQTHPIVSAETIGIRTLAEYEERARRLAQYPWIKVKVGKTQAVEAVTAVRRGAPKSRLVVDANQAWSVAQLRELAPEMARLGVDLLEQPVPVDQDKALEGLNLPVALCADEPANTSADVETLAQRYDFVNIKLDKSGGLTAALDLAWAAQEAGMRLMVGCMLGSSLAMAPAMVIAQFCDVVDLDGPLLQAEDWPDGIGYHNGTMTPPERAFWG